MAIGTVQQTSLTKGIFLHAADGNRKMNERSIIDFIPLTLSMTTMKVRGLNARENKSIMPVLLRVIAGNSAFFTNVS